MLLLPKFPVHMPLINPTTLVFRGGEGFLHSTERGSGAARRAMGFLTRWLAGKMEDPAKRQADFEKHMTTTMAKCEEM